MLIIIVLKYLYTCLSTVLNREDPDWYWIVRSDGQEGFIPSGFVYPAVVQGIYTIIIMSKLYFYNLMRYTDLSIPLLDEGFVENRERSKHTCLDSPAKQSKSATLISKI